MTPTLQGLLVRAADATPDAPAIGTAGGTVSYGVLVDRVAALAATWAAAGVGAGDRIVLVLPKGAEGITAAWGALWLGAAYVPIDPASPPARLAAIADAADAAGIVAPPRLLDVVSEGLPEWTPPPALALAAHGPGRAAPADDPDRPAYVLFTSGSTGTPRGAVHTHRSALAFVTWAREALGLRPGDRLSQHAGLHFDLSTLDVFGAAAAGASVWPVPEPRTFRGRLLARFLRDQAITVAYAVPLAWQRALEPSAAPLLAEAPLRAAVFAGEVFPIDALRRLRATLPAARLLNLYGPTETNVCTWHEVAADDLGPDRTAIPIGLPASGDAVTVEERRILVRGPSVMTGYLGAAPLAEACWDTGDLGRVDDEGRLWFEGRADDQIKVSGVRLELGDVEAALLVHPAVTEAAAALADGAVVAAVVLGHPAPLDEIRAMAGARLPRVGVPRLVTVDAVPRTSNGKVDRQAVTRLVGGR